MKAATGDVADYPGRADGDRSDHGHVIAMVGGRDFGESHFNRAVQAKRQSGSAFAVRLRDGARRATHRRRSLPASTIRSLTVQGAWLPDDDHSSENELTMRSALRTSSNRAAVQMLNAVGISKAVSYAEKLNIGKMPSVPSLALGAGDVTLASLTAAYGAFANGGIVRTPLLIRSVQDNDGKVLYREEDKSHRAVSESTAFLMSSMLSDVVNAGTGNRARQAGFTLPAAGKTGTTNDYNDAWFVGYTPHLVTGVWVGFDRPQKIASGGYAGELAVPIWAAFMKLATKDAKPDWFDRPSNVIGLNVCRVSGKLPSGGCEHAQVVNRDGAIETRSMVYTEISSVDPARYRVHAARAAVVRRAHREHLWQRRRHARLGRGRGTAACRKHLRGAGQPIGRRGGASRRSGESRGTQQEEARLLGADLWRPQ